MKSICVEIDIQCPEKLHLELSSFVKTIMHTLDQAIESKDPAVDFKFIVEGCHPDAVTTTAGEPHSLRKTFGL